MKKLRIYETDNVERLIKLQSMLSRAGIDYETKPKTSNLFQDFLNLLFFQVLTPGMQKAKNINCIYVNESDIEAVKRIIQQYFI